MIQSYCPHQGDVIPQYSCQICFPVPEHWRNNNPPQGLARYISMCPVACGEPILIGEIIIRGKLGTWVHRRCSEVTRK